MKKRKESSSFDDKIIRQYIALYQSGDVSDTQKKTIEESIVDMFDDYIKKIINQKFPTLSSRANESDFLNVVQDARMEVIKAMKNFDLKKNILFSSYLTDYIIYAGYDYLGKTSLIALPSYIQNMYVKINKNSEELKKIRGREVSIRDIILYTLKKDGVPETIDNYQKLERIIYRIKKSKDIQSIDFLSQRKNEDGDTIDFAIESKGEEKEWQRLEEEEKRAELNELVNQIKKRLNDKQKYILEKKIEFAKQGKKMNYADVANSMGLSRERVRQIWKEIDIKIEQFRSKK